MIDIPIIVDQLTQHFLSESMQRDLWTHEAHVIVATVVLFESGLEEGSRLIKCLIPRNNEVMGVANTETSGYHETLTQFYINQIHRVLEQENFRDKYVAVEFILASEITQREYPLRYYSKERLFSVEARQNYLEPCKD